MDKDGNPLSTIENFLTIMENDRAFAGVRYNEVSARAEIHTTRNGRPYIARWSDADEAQSMDHIERYYGLYSREKHAAALKILFEKRRYNPIQDLVDAQVWDGIPRCQSFLHRWGKVEDTPYSREVSRLIFAGGVHRLYEPGTKFEDVPIIMGRQGSGKSTLIRYLAINDDYFGELKQMEGQQAIEDLSGKWIIEIPEMSAFTRAKDQEAIKAFVSRQRDQYRKPYDRHPTELPRRCIFVASSNDLSPLVDKTGNRRWYPLEVKSDGYDIFDHEDEIRDYVLQCWAEAKSKMDTPEMRPYADKALLKEYTEAQESAMQDDWRVGAIAAFLDRKRAGELTCVREVCHRALSPNPDFPKEPTLVESKDIGKILNRMEGWRRVNGARNVGIYGKQRCWEKLPEEQAAPEPEPEPDKPFWEE